LEQLAGGTLESGVMIPADSLGDITDFMSDTEVLCLIDKIN
jgi:hypothetical protein